MAIIVQKIFLGWPLLFALLLPSCGQVCIMGQGECPAFKSDTKLTITPQSPIITKDPASNQTLNFQLSGGTPNYSLSASWSTTSGLAGFNSSSFSGKSASASTSSANFSLIINKDAAISVQEIITITAEDKNGKTASATITINPAPNP